MNDAAHPVYQHRDGTKCIWLRDVGWFAPFDISGGGEDCDNPEHEEQKLFYQRRK